MTSLLLVAIAAAVLNFIAAVIIIELDRRGPARLSQATTFSAPALSTAEAFTTTQ
jgi:hypothetical protein